MLSEDLADPGLPVEQQAQNQQQLEAVKHAIAALPNKQREALILRKYQELSYEEISAILDTSVEGARANVYQGLRKLRTQFERADSLAVPNLAEESSEVGQ